MVFFGTFNYMVDAKYLFTLRMTLLKKIKQKIRMTNFYPKIRLITLNMVTNKTTNSS